VVEGRDSTADHGGPDGATRLTSEQAALCGMGVAVAAREFPDRLAIASPHGDRSFAFLNARVNQLSRALRRRGLRSGDGVALLCANRPEFVVAFLATLRTGLRLTPINTGLRPGEIRYIVEDCEARALLADGRFAAAARDAVRDLPRVGIRIGIGDPLTGFEPWDEVLGVEEGHDLVDPELGSQMPYTSGTTGRPKGVHRPPGAALRQPGLAAAIASLDYDPQRDVHLCTGPLHHAGPLVFSLAIPLGLGVPVVLMDRWDAERALRLIACYRITHTHMVPVMFRRLLELPDDVRSAWDTSSLRVLLHGAAPCPLAVKRAIIEWLGPVVYEYYAATEGWGCLATSEEWLERPGTVGRPAAGDVDVRDLEGKSLPPGREGVVYLRVPDGGRFEYYRDDPMTRAAYAGDYFTLGDVGLLDAEGYLYLRDRNADVIHSGGVDVYPAEVDAVLVTHPAVADAATVGVPHDEWGEHVVSIVELADGYLGSDALVEELRGLCARELAAFKCPRQIHFEERLPRLENGKIYRRLLRDRLRSAP
jgi:long-chain acyl-CoA synthetase